MNIRFTINPQKAIEALVWIIQRGETNVYNAMKILFAADKYHLNTHYRPVLGDRYVAMQFGTVPSWTYDATRLTTPGIGFKRHENTLTLEPGREFNRRKFSESDLEALEHGFNEYAGKSFDEVKRKNHREKAWRMARKRNPENGAPDILYEDMIAGKQWLVDDLKELGHCLSI